MILQMMRLKIIDQGGLQHVTHKTYVLMQSTEMQWSLCMRNQSIEFKKKVAYYYYYYHYNVQTSILSNIVHVYACID